jgi:Glycosyltransferase family 87
MVVATARHFSERARWCDILLDMGLEPDPASRELSIGRSVLARLLHRRWLWLAGFPVASAALAIVLAAVRRRGELPVYTTAAWRLLAGEDIYRSTDVKPFTYPPFFALPALPLLALPDLLRAPAWYFVNLLALSAGVALLLRRIWPVLPAPGQGAGPSRGVFVALLGVASAQHLLAPIEYASHDALLFLALMLGTSAWAGGASARAGAFLGLGAAAKATPLLFLALFVWKRDLRAALALAVIAVAAALAPDVLFPRPDGNLWVVAWYQAFIAPLRVAWPAEVKGVWRASNHLNQGLSATLYRLLTPVPGSRKAPDVSLLDAGPAVISVVVVLGQVAVLGLLAWATRPAPETAISAAERGFRRLGEAGAVCSAMLLLSPMSSRQHFTVLLVPLAVCLADFLYRQRTAVVGVLLVIMTLSATATAKDIVSRAIGNRFLAYGTLTACALAALLATSWVLSARRRVIPGAGHGAAGGRQASAMGAAPSA